MTPLGRIVVSLWLRNACKNVHYKLFDHCRQPAVQMWQKTEAGIV